MWGKTNEPVSSLECESASPGAALNPPPTERISRSAVRRRRRRRASRPPSARRRASAARSTAKRNCTSTARVDGSIEVRNLLTIGPNGKIKANVKAKELVVRGSIQGDVEASRANLHHERRQHRRRRKDGRHRH